MSGSLYAVTMPKWGLAMTEGKVTSWLVDVGSEISPGDELVEIETSKIANVFEAPAQGTLLRRLTEPGLTVSVGDILGVIGAAGTADAEIDAFVEAFRADFVPPEKDDDAAGGPAYQTVTVAGHSIRHLRMGEGPATPLVLIHGYGGDINNWLFNQESLSARRPVHAFDLPGHGGSSKQLAGADIVAQAAFVADLLSSLGIERAHVAGHSMGGAIGLALALGNPEKVASLTLLCSAGLGREINTAYTDGLVTAEKRKELKPILELLFANPSLVNRTMVDDMLAYKRLDGVAESLRRIGHACFVNGRQETVFTERLNEIAVPAQAIWGDMDAIIPVAHASAVAEHHVIQGCGHMVHLEGAASVNGLVERFLARADDR